MNVLHKLRLLAWAAAGLALATAASAQTLGAAAEREKERRKGGPVPTYSDTDLADGSRGRGTYNPSSTSGATAAPGPTTASGTNDGRDGEVYWRARADRGRALIAFSEARVLSVQAHLDRHVLSLVASCNGQPISRRAHIADVARERESVTRQAAAARQAWRDLEDEARRGFAAPGWLRER